MVTLNLSREHVVFSLGLAVLATGCRQTILGKVKLMLKPILLAFAVCLLFAAEAMGQESDNQPVSCSEFKKLLTNGTWYRTLGPNDWSREDLAYTFRSDGKLGFCRISDVRIFREAKWTIKPAKKPNQFEFHVEHVRDKNIGSVIQLRSGTVLRYAPKEKRIYLIEKRLVKGVFLQNSPGSVYEKGWIPEDRKAK